MLTRFLIVACAGGVLLACGDDKPVIVPGDLTGIPYDPRPLVVGIPETYPQLEIPADNPMTFEGVALGRMLFFDPVLSRDSSISCSSCHLPEMSFTDGNALSKGVAGLEGRRSAMNLLDIAFHHAGLFWDGRSPTLEEQALHPVTDPLEMDEVWENVELRLQEHPDYPVLFREAFGIARTADITRDLVTKAIAQFERTLVTSGNSRYDRAVRGEVFFTDSEFNGYDMFFDASGTKDAHCAHCHAAPLFTIDEFRNNGIEAVSGLDNFPDPGRGEVTGAQLDNGMFKVPTLRNIGFTAPYMHNGRFNTLEEVIEHYNSGGHRQPNTDPFITQLFLTEQQKQDLLAFLMTLADTTFLGNPDFQNPF